MERVLAVDLGGTNLRVAVVGADGAVTGTGEEATGNALAADAAAYRVEDVPSVLYFNLDAEALHGAYWHDSFGQKMSHGCVNLPPAFAAWLYGWAPLGTGVWVHE